MRLNNATPTKTILDTGPLLKEYRNYLEVNWLFTVDLGSLISIIVSCYYYTGTAHDELEKFINGLDPEFFHVKSDVTSLQVEFVKTVVRNLVQDLDEYFNNARLLQHEYFNHEYDGMLPDGSIVLRSRESQ